MLSTLRKLQVSEELDKETLVEGTGGGTMITPEVQQKGISTSL